MSKADHTLTATPGFRAMKLSRDWITRPVFGVLLIAVWLAAIFAGRPYVEIVVAAAVAAAAREWHRMTGGGRFAVELAVTTGTVWLALLTYLFWPDKRVLPLVLMAGTLLVLAVSLLRRGNPLWQAGAVFYLGLPSLALLMLRDIRPHGIWIVVGLFLIVWATDTGALFVGTTVGGPKLAPVLSPKKTWSGTIGGIVAAAAAQAVFIAILGGHVPAAAAYGASIGVVAHLGDLFESMVKRHFHMKDSGSSIPGHGGVLDRVDSTISSTVAVAVAVFAFHLDPLFGALP